MVDGPGFGAGSWKAAEENAARWLRRWGWSDARVTPPGPDDGLDVIGTGVVAQVKWKASATGASAIRDFVGAAAVLPDVQRIFFSGSGYTASALRHADATQTALFTYDLSGEVTAVNATARKVRLRDAPAPQIVPEPRPVRPSATDRKADPVTRTWAEEWRAAKAANPPRPKIKREKQTGQMRATHQFIAEARAAKRSSRQKARGKRVWPWKRPKVEKPVAGPVKEPETVLKRLRPKADGTYRMVSKRRSARRLFRK